LFRIYISVLFVLFGVSQPALPQGQMPPTPVRFTEAQAHRVRGVVRLPGSVEPKTTSLVASEIGGLTVEFPVREGDSVRKGQLLARLNARQLELRLGEIDAQLREAEARLKLSERNLERARELFESQIFSQQQLDDNTYEVNALRARLATLASQKSQLEYDIERTDIVAPFDGVVTREETQVGQWLGAGSPVVELMATDVEVVVSAPERYYRQLRPGSKVPIVFESLNGLRVMGTVAAVVPKADPQARTYPVRLTFPNQGGKIPAGMLAEATLPGGDAYDAVIVPKDAVVTRGAEKTIFLLNGDNTVEPLRVGTGAGAGDWVEVQGSLRAGQRVITRGNERLRPGQKVNPEPLSYELP
jgi:RND family efflux transporter MFP subunit